MRINKIDLSIIIPLFNEEKTLEIIVNKIQKLRINYSKEIIIVNDGSTDRSYKIAKKLMDKYRNITLISYYKNVGKGNAIKKGLMKAKGELVIIQDADLEYNPNCYKKMLEKLNKENALVAYGSRRLEKSNKQYSGILFFWGGMLLTYLCNFLYKSNITDESTGYKLFNRKLLKSLKLKCKRFEFCPEVTAKILKKKIKIFEVPIKYKPRHINQGKKINLLDFLEAIWVLFKYRFYNGY